MAEEAKKTQEKETKKAPEKKASSEQSSKQSPADGSKKIAIIQYFFEEIFGMVSSFLVIIKY